MTRKRAEPHLDRDVLLELAGGTALPAPARAHLDACGECRAALAETGQLLADLRARDLVEPGAALVSAVVELFPQRPPLASRIVEALGRLVRIESPSPAFASAGVRGPGAAAPARSLFEHDGIEVDLEVSGEPGARRLTGQALDGNGTGVDGIAWAEHGTWRGDETAVGAHGMFQLDRVPDGPFDLVLELAAGRVRFAIRPE